MRRIIDAHAHLGDIFHENKNITFKTNVQKGDYPDPFVQLDLDGYVRPLMPQNEEEVNIVINAGQYKVWESTLENLSKSLDENKIDFICLMPILPNTSFEEYLAASKLENRIIPWTSCDFNLPVEDMCAKLMKDIARGAKGLKIHLTLQNISNDDPKVHAAVEVMGEAGLPVAFHCGVNLYYTPEKAKIFKTNPEASELTNIVEIAKVHPDTNIIAAHAGGVMGGEMEALAEKGAHLKNLYTDTSLRSTEYMLKIVEAFGEDKVMFGTDYPFLSQKHSLKAAEDAFGNNPELADKIFFRNVARLMGIEKELAEVAAAKDK
ncbi:MAG: amidohydrolase family protein [Desulfitobacteriia bacterium]|jgi:predicted TIM-barrel fold metal-dependent hydrolase